MTDELAAKDHLINLVKEFDTGMLATFGERGAVRARPMGLAEVTEDGRLHFMSSLDSGKVQEVRQDPRANVSFQGKAKWVTLSGTVEISQDRELIKRLWSDSWKIWFPEGKTDPTLCVLQFQPTEGEYWDNTGSRGLWFAVEATKAFLSGRAAEATSKEQNAKVQL